MSARRRLDAVARRLDAQRRPQDDAARRERERLDAMTDEELALRLDAYARLVEVMRDCWPVSYTHLTLPTNREV